jgi:hypothetical protein
LECRRQRPPFLAHFSQPSGRRTAPRHPWSLPRELVRQYLPLAAGEQCPARIHRSLSNIEFKRYCLRS